MRPASPRSRRPPGTTHSTASLPTRRRDSAWTVTRHERCCDGPRSSTASCAWHTATSRGTNGGCPPHTVRTDCGPHCVTGRSISPQQRAKVPADTRTRRGASSGPTVARPSLSGCVETPRSPGVTREGVTGDSLVSSNSPGLPGAGDHLAAGSIEAVPDPAARPVRRSFTAAYRARVVAEYEAAPRGSKAAVLRREGLYQSQIREWTIARDALTRGAASYSATTRATVSGGKDDPGRLRAENQRLTRELATSQAVVEIMGKLQGLLEQISESTAATSSSTRR